MLLRTLGPNHPKCQAFIKAEDNAVREHNDAARRLNEKAGQHLMSYKRNRYTNTMPLSALLTSLFYCTSKAESVLIILWT